MYTIKDIAQKCKVSPATVSNVINGKTNKVSQETADLILSTINAMGYKPNAVAKGLRTKKTKIIGVVSEDISLFNVPPIINGITTCCEEYGYMFLLENLRLYHRWGGTWFDDNEKYDSVFKPAMDEMEAINADGIIYVAGHSRKIKSLKQNDSRPVVVAYSITDDKNIPHYVIDDEGAGADVTKYLTEQGHKRIGVIGGELENLHTQLRLKGYEKALRANGIKYDSELVVCGSWSRDNGYKKAGELIEKGATAIFCFSDSIAGGVYDYLEEHNLKVGKDIAVCGFDDREYSSYMNPKLTTVMLPTPEIGFRSAKRLIEMIEGKQGELSIENKLSCKLAKRQSS